MFSFYNQSVPTDAMRNNSLLGTAKKLFKKHYLMGLYKFAIQAHRVVRSIVFCRILLAWAPIASTPTLPFFSHLLIMQGYGVYGYMGWGRNWKKKTYGISLTNYKNYMNCSLFTLQTILYNNLLIYNVTSVT